MSEKLNWSQIPRLGTCMTGVGSGDCLQSELTDGLTSVTFDN